MLLLVNLDWLIGLGIPVTLIILYFKSKIGTKILALAILAYLTGFTWEIIFYFNGPGISDDPIYTQFVDVAQYPIMQTLLHSSWDMGLFLIGYLLVVKLKKGTHFTSFKTSELAIFIIWGQFQELIVELIATGFQLWTFHSFWWNPPLFKFGHGEITLMPQLVWLIGSTLFYFMILKVNKFIENKEISVN